MPSAVHLVHLDDVGVEKISKEIACSRSEGNPLNSGRKSRGICAERKATVVSAIVVNPHDRWPVVNAARWALTMQCWSAPNRAKQSGISNERLA